MNVKEVLSAFLLVNNPIVLSGEETKDVQKAIKQLQQENKILKENAENNDKVVDKVNWENMLLKKENKQLQEELECTIGIVEHNRIISEKNKEIHQLKDNWNKLRKYFNERIEVCDNRLSTPFCNFEKATKERLIFSQCLEKLEELEQGSDNK